MTPARRERANRWCFAIGAWSVVASYVYLQVAWKWFSWRAVGFAVSSVFAVLFAAVALLMFWIATSVDANE